MPYAALLRGRLEFWLTKAATHTGCHGVFDMDEPCLYEMDHPFPEVSISDALEQRVANKRRISRRVAPVRVRWVEFLNGAAGARLLCPDWIAIDRRGFASLGGRFDIHNNAVFIINRGFKRHGRILLQSGNAKAATQGRGGTTGLHRNIDRTFNDNRDRCHSKTVLTEAAAAAHTPSARTVVAG